MDVTSQLKEINSRARHEITDTISLGLATVLFVVVAVTYLLDTLPQRGLDHGRNPGAILHHLFCDEPLVRILRILLNVTTLLFFLWCFAVRTSVGAAEMCR